MALDTQHVLGVGAQKLNELSGYSFDLLSISKPTSPGAAVNLSKIISKISPLLGNLIEFHVVEYLNEIEELKSFGEWHRQDPGFPDTIFKGSIDPAPGFEIKAWFPLATEITARFKDSQNHFQHDETNVCMLAWLPENLIFGRPKIVDVCIVSGKSVAKARDDHYHNPPDYLVSEPENTSDRTSNLQQTNTNGHKWQSKNLTERSDAQKLVDSWGHDKRNYDPSPEYQKMVRQLLKRYDYRPDTNFAKMDRIEHEGIETFKSRVLNKSQFGLKIRDWSKLFSKATEAEVKAILAEKFDIK